MDILTGFKAFIFDTECFLLYTSARFDNEYITYLCCTVCSCVYSYKRRTHSSNSPLISIILFLKINFMYVKL